MSRRLGGGSIKEVWPSIPHIDGGRDNRGLTDVRYDLKGFGNGGAVVDTINLVVLRSSSRNDALQDAGQTLLSWIIARSN
jgi:hypothetical protein